MGASEELKPCLACSKRRPAREVTNYTTDPNIKQKFLEFLQIQKMGEKAVPNTICSNCVIRMNCCVEFQRRIKQNILEHRIQYYYKINRRTHMQKYQNELKVLQSKCSALPSEVANTIFGDTSIMQLMDTDMTDASPSGADSSVNADSTGFIISDVRTEEIAQEPNSTGDEFDMMEDKRSRSPTVVPVSRTNSNCSSSIVELLEPMFQTSENVHETESGGNIQGRRKQNEAANYQCTYCYKIYRKMNAWRKHERGHRAEQRRNAAIGLPSSTKSTAAVVTKKRKYKCTDCDLEFDTINGWRKHGIVHEQQHECQLCGQLFRLQLEYEWHLICCNAKNSINGTTTTQRHTRAIGMFSDTASFNVHQAKQCSITECGPNDAQPEADNHSESHRRSVDTPETGSIYNDKMETVKLWTSQLDIGDKPDPTELMDSNIDDGNNDEDVMSVLSDVTDMTNYTAVSSSILTADVEQLSQLSLEEDVSSIDFSTKEHNRNRRRIQRAAKRRARENGRAYYTCSFPHLCIFGSTSLSKTMFHEATEHNALLLHNCRECNQWFTNREFLIRHQKQHRQQPYICIKCNELFDNKYELEHHTLLHTEKSYDCPFCDMSFLKSTALNCHELLHPSGTVRRSGIIQRTAVSKKTVECNSKKQQIFDGYKSKDLIQPQKASTSYFAGCTAKSSSGRLKSPSFRVRSKLNSAVDRGNNQGSVLETCNTFSDREFDTNTAGQCAAVPELTGSSFQLPFVPMGSPLPPGMGVASEPVRFVPSNRTKSVKHQMADGKRRKIRRTGGMDYANDPKLLKYPIVIIEKYIPQDGTAVSQILNK